MRYETARKDAQIALDGITVETERVDGGLRAVTLRDAKGGMVRFSTPYGLDALVPAAPVMVDKWRLAGNIAGVPVEHFYDHEYEANEKRDEYVNALRYPESALVTVEKVQVAEAA